MAMWRFTLLLPSSWRPEIQAAAEANGVKMADVIRMAVRSFLSARYQEPRP